MFIAGIARAPAARRGGRALAWAAMRVSTVIMTERTQLTRIHNAARVISASRGAVRLSGDRITVG
jgi:hypothetical protein